MECIIGMLAHQLRKNAPVTGRDWKKASLGTTRHFGQLELYTLEVEKACATAAALLMWLGLGPGTPHGGCPQVPEVSPTQYEASLHKPLVVPDLTQWKTHWKRQSQLYLRDWKHQFTDDTSQPPPPPPSGPHAQAQQEPRPRTSTDQSSEEWSHQDGQIQQMVTQMD